jgi:hypothetical protein
MANISVIKKQNRTQIFMEIPYPANKEIYKERKDYIMTRRLKVGIVHC